MGRVRKDPTERVRTLTINLQQKIIDEIAKQGSPKQVIEEELIKKYSPSRASHGVEG